MDLPSKIVSFIFKTLFNHFRFIFIHLDPVKDVTNRKINPRTHFQDKHGSDAPSRLNYQYLFPTLSLLHINLDNLYIAWQYDFAFKSRPMPELFLRRIFPKAMAQQNDVMIGLACGMSFTVYTCLLFDSNLDSKYIMYLFPENGTWNPAIRMNGKPINSTESGKITRFRHKMKQFLTISMNLINVEILGLGLYCFFSNFWIGSLHDYTMLPCVFSFLIYGNTSNFFLIQYFCLSVNYLKIKQKSKAARYGNLGKRIAQKANTLTKYRNSTLLWFKYKRINAEISSFYQEILAYNAFWSKYLSIYFAVYIIEACYTLFVYFFVELDLGNPVFNQLMLIFSVQFVGLLLFVTRECSKIGNVNKKMARNGQKMGLDLSQITKLKLEDQLKIDSMEANFKNIKTVSFQLLDGNVINSQMFQMIFVYISILFMMVIRSYKNNQQNV